MFKCDQCQDILARHLKRHNSNESFKCTICGNLFTRNDALKRHIKSIHDSTDSGMQLNEAVSVSRVLYLLLLLSLDNMDTGINKQPAVPTVAPAAPLVPTVPEAINGNMFEDSDDELCVQLLNEVENTELCKNDSNIMFEDSDDELCVQLLEEVENTNAKQQDMLEIAPNIFVENNPAETSNKKNMITNIKTITNFTDGDIVNMHPDNPKFFSPISTGNMTSNISGQKILNKICSILTSDQSVNINETVFSFQVIIMPKGGKPKPSWEYLNLFTKNKRCVTEINNQDELCCPRAILVGLSYKTADILGHKLTDSQIKDLRNGRNNIQTLKVVNVDNFCEIDYSGNENRIKIYLLKKNDHFHTI
ncbi:hypothetical protein AGLY_016411 [Aphis glycines]|uniref:C2H2-type domain-containing protein n=1 Tax=Aphis glycines TaxID=307491 RepID=A0A6G0SYF1_APHGL|nr:hypothetical protein AGLY_016411 [Aphis glycines]